MERILINKVDRKFEDEIAARCEAAISSCIQCGTCTGNCLVANVDSNYNPRKIIHMLLSRTKDYFKEKPELPYSCNLCELCKKTCPKGLNVGELNQLLREWLVTEGVGPLPRHKAAIEEVEWALSPSFALSLPDPDAAECNRVFFPGCNLAAYSPSLVIATWDYLRERLPGIGIILRCCGAPCHHLGELSLSQEIVAGLESEVDKLGASEVITPCPDCFRHLKRAAPSFELKSLYEVLVEIGLPQVSHGGQHTFSLHDSCTTRWETKLQNDVREVIKLAGYQIEELTHSRELTLCCGVGGIILPLSMARVMRITKERVAEAHFEMLSYCAACRETFAPHKPSLHVLDLLFNPNWEKDMNQPGKKPLARRDNQTRLKSLLAER